MTTVSIHQPNYLPYLGFFDKMANSDIFVIHDDVQFNRRDFQHRNKIRTFDGWKWLSIPVKKKTGYIFDIDINNDKQNNSASWSEIHYREIYANYSHCPFFSEYEDELFSIYNTKHEKLIDFNMSLIKFLIEAFDIDVELVFASKFGFKSSSSEKIIELVSALGGDCYISGIGGYNYLDTSIFGNIEVVFQNFNHPIYPQRFEGFESNMSSIDALFNVGIIP
ncbi:WbqC family protein [Methanolobus sp. ZRKC5]|uniref:WbqC family protein n=1 Tax=unclassified Methanolobus TaxID=2629569 RepID=UPI00313E1C4A